MRFGLFLELQMPKPWTATSEYDCLWQAVKQVSYAEEVGFEHVWLVEHHFLSEFAHSSAPEVTLAVMAQHTSTMRLGFGVVLAPVHHPLHVAARVATLDILSNGRVDVGVGRTKGPYQLTPFGVDVGDTQDLMLETLQCLPGMWTQEVFSHQGKHWNIPPREVIPHPIQKPHPPLWMACTQEETFRLAGELGMGCLVNTLGGPEKTRKLVDLYQETIKTATPVGHFVNRQVVASTMGFCDESDRRAREKGAEMAAWYLNQSKQRFTLEWQGVDPGSVPESYRFYMKGGSRMLDPQQVNPPSPQELIAGGGYCIGNPDSCIRVIEEFESMGVDEIMPIFQAGHATHDEVMNSIRLFGKYVIPHFREKERRAGAAAGRSAADN
ncbi:MAG TPA: LLM class flavin-dependent oxidoreductase [Dehalococcoidia bacterium]|nr:LLM class flavin-dependent oxidoreductase [Dehalococcoidia bacterium]